MSYAALQQCLYHHFRTKFLAIRGIDGNLYKCESELESHCGMDIDWVNEDVIDFEPDEG